MNKDLDVLLDCIGFQLDDPSSLSQALLTIATMCTGNDVMKNQLRASRGLALIQNVLTSTKSSKVKEAAMYCLGCAIEKNVFSQKELCSLSMFSMLHKTLAVSDQNERARQVSLFLTICLVANCEMGQFLVRRSGCLRILLQLFISAFPRDSASDAIGKDILGWVDNGDSTDGSVIWCTVTRALCMCVNNPQNEENQQMCARVFPTAFQYLKSCLETEIVQPLTSFIALSVADNAANKEKVYRCQGLNTLCHALSRAVNEQKALENIICYTNALDASIMDSRRNAEVCGRLGILGILWKLLKEWDLPLSTKTQLVLTLDHCTEKTECNQVEWVKMGGVALLVELLTNTTDEELSNTVKCILQKCISIDAVSCRTPSMVRCSSFGCNSKEPDSSSAADKDHTGNDLAKKLEVLEQQTNKRFEQIQAFLTPCQTQTMQTATFSKQGERTQERHLAISEKNTTSESELTGEPGMLSESTSEKMRQYETSQLWIQKQHLQTERKMLNKSKEVENMPRNYMQCGSREVNQKQGQTERTDMQLEALPFGFNSGHFFRKNEESAIFDQADRQEEEEHKEQEEEMMERYETVEGEEEEEESEYEEEGAEEEKKAIVSKNGSFPSTNITRKMLDREEVNRGKCKQGRQVGTVNGEFCGNCEMERKAETQKRGPKNNQMSKIFAKKMTIRAMNSEDRHPRDSPNRFAVTHTLKENSRISAALPMDVQHITPKLHANSSHLETNHDKMKKRHVLQHEDDETDDPELCGEAVLPDSALHFKRPVAVPLRSTGRPQTDRNRSVLQAIPPPSPCQSEFDLELVAAAGSGKGRRVQTPDDQYHGGSKKVNCTSFTEPSIFKSCSQQKQIPPKRKIVSTDGGKNEPTVLNAGSTAAFGEDGKRNQCPGCCAPSELGFPLLNSRTFNIALETSCHSCSIHRYVRQLERSFAAAVKREGKSERQGPKGHLLRREPAFSFQTRSKCQISEDVYEFNGSSDSMTISSPEDDVTDCESDDEKEEGAVWSRSTSPSRARRARVPYSHTEEENLLTGVARLGKFWKQILYAYEFHPSRTAVDLMEKYKRIKDSSAVDHRSPPSPFSSTSTAHPRHPPLSMAEERRLRRGVHLHGYNWTAILNAYRFAKGRTAQELRDRWRSMHGARNKSFGSVR